MNNFSYKIFTIALFSFGLLFSACQKDFELKQSDAEDTETPNNTRGFFTCEINGEPFTAEFQSYYKLDTLGYKLLTFDGIKYDYTRRVEDYTSVSMTINYYDGVGEYPISGAASGSITISTYDNGVTNYFYPVANPDAKVAVTGESGNYTGTFSFDCKSSTSSTDTMRITNGKFEIPVN